MTELRRTDSPEENRSDSSAGETHPGSDSIRTVLSDRRRRYVVHYLKRQENAETVGLDRLAAQVAAWETGKPVERLTEPEQMRIYASLQREHLPLMAQAGVVEFDKRRNDVRLAEWMSDVELYLESVPPDDISWSQYYLSLSVLSSLLVAVAALDVPLIGGIDWIVLTVLLVGLFGVSALVHLYRSSAARIGGKENVP